MNLLEDIAANLRKPDCDHTHTSFPEADVVTIVQALRRHPEEAMELVVPRGWVAVEIPRVEAMFRLLTDSGDMTPMATRQLGKLLHPEDEEST